MLAPCYSQQNYWDYFDLNFSGKKVLDIGSSLGSFYKTRKFNNVLTSIKKAEEYISLDIDSNSGADIICDAHELPFIDEYFDIIIANNIIEHLYDPTKGINEMYRVLKKGGRLYYTVPFLYPIHEAPHDYQRFTRFGLKRLFGSFGEIEIYSRGGWCSTISNLLFMFTYVFDRVKLGVLIRLLLYPTLYCFTQLDRFDKSEQFVRVYFGSTVK